tara:strand:+ start:43 stop:186 length:144 start_codon:yes stop_codon:yes gene_type:complete
MQYHMEVIRHDGISSDINTEDLSLIENQFLNPSTAMLKRTTFGVYAA